MLVRPTGVPGLVRAGEQARSARIPVARVAAVSGVLAYNWWVVVPFVPGLMPSVNGFFSDLEADGRPHAAVMAHADLLAGILLLVALFLRGPHAEGSVRREWKWLLAFAAAGALGGRFTYSCAEGLSAACRSMEWHLRLPAHHYVHVVSGIAEFAALSVAALLAARRTHGQATTPARLYSGIRTALLVGYPFLGIAYLGDRLGALVEPYFFIVFTLMVLTEVFEPIDAPAPTLPWVQRVLARSHGPMGDRPSGVAAASGLD